MTTQRNVAAEKNTRDSESAVRNGVATDESKGEPPTQSEDPARRPASKRKRRVQHVSTYQERSEVVQWMVAESERCGTDKHIKAKAVREFRAYFRGSAKANFMKVSRWWNSRGKAQQVPAMGNGANSEAVRKMLLRKAAPGRGRKRLAWIEFMHRELLKEVKRCQKPGHKFPVSKLLVMARSVLQNSRGAFTHETKVDGVQLIEKVNKRWIQNFVERFGIDTESVRRQTSGSASSSDMSEEWEELDAQPPIQAAIGAK